MISIITLLIILVPTTIGVMHHLWQVLVRRVPERIADPHLPIVWGIFLVGMLDCMTYAVRGSISTKSFSILFPFLALFYLQRLGQHTGKRLLFHGFAALLLMTSVVKFGIFYKNSFVIGQKAQNSPLETVLPSANWLDEHLSQDKISLLSGLDLYGKYLLYSVDQEIEPIFQSYSLEQLSQVAGVSDETWSNPPDLMAIDRQSIEPTTGFVWIRLNPIQTYSPLIRQNRQLNFVYDDGAVWLIKPSKEETVIRKQETVNSKQ